MNRTGVAFVFVALSAAFLWAPDMTTAWRTNALGVQVTRAAGAARTAQPAAWPWRIRPGTCQPEPRLSDRAHESIQPRQARLLGMWALACGDLAEARQWFAPLLVARPNDPVVARGWAAGLLAQGSPQEMLDFLADRKLDISPLSVSLAALAYEEGHLAEAVGWLDRMAVWLTEPVMATRFTFYERACIIYGAARRLDAAIAACQATAELAPAIGSNWLVLGRAYLWAGRFPEAQAALQHAVAIEPQNGVFYYYLGQVHEKQDQAEEAWDAYQQAVVLTPNYGSVRLRLADLEAARGHKGQAIAHLQAALTADDAYIREQAQRQLDQLNGD